MTNFEYFICLLQENEDLVKEINSMESEYIPELLNSVCESVYTYYEYYVDKNEN